MTAGGRCTERRIRKPRANEILLTNVAIERDGLRERVAGLEERLARREQEALVDEYKLHNALAEVHRLQSKLDALRKAVAELSRCVGASEGVTLTYYMRGMVSEDLIGLIGEIEEPPT